MVLTRILVVAVAALALAPAAASADAVCTLQFDVTFDSGGRFSDDGTGRGVCAGEVAGVTLDPGAANPSISGAGSCTALLDSGQISLRPRRGFEFFAPEHVEISGGWRATAGVLTGTLVTETTAVDANGELVVVPNGDGCRIDVHLVLGGERPAPRQQPQTAPAAEPEPAQPAAASKPASSRRKSCRRAKGKGRKAKRCRRAKRRA